MREQDSSPLGGAASTGAWQAVLGLLLLTIVLTWPWPIDPLHRTAGPPGGDNRFSMALWSLVADCSSLFSSVAHCGGWPDGVQSSLGIQLGSAFSTLFYWAGAETWGSVPTHGLIVFSGLFLTGGFAFLLVRRATGSVPAAFVAGVAFESSQHLVVIANAAATYTHAWLTLLPLAAWWFAAERPSRRVALLVGASVLPAGLWSPYPAEHALVVWAACGIVVAGRTFRRSPSLAVHWAWSLVPVGAFGDAALIIRLFFHENVPVRDSVDAYTQALAPFLLLKPARDSAVWGAGPDRLVSSLVPSAQGVAVYLGVVVFALAVVGAIVTLGRGRTSLPRRAALLGRLALASFVVCLAFAQQPTVLGVPTPGWLIAELLPELRAGQRFILPISGAAAILAGMAWARIAPRRRSTCALLTLALAVAIAADGYVRQPGYMSLKPEPSAALASLPSRGDGPVLHVPWGLHGFTEPSLPCFVRNYPQPLVNTCLPARSSVGNIVIERMIVDVCEGLTVARKLGVRFMIVDRLNEYTGSATIVDLPAFDACLYRMAKAHEARFLARDPIRALWEFT